MKPSWTRKLLIGMALSSILGTTYAPAQSASEEGKRKVKTRANPTYPDLARRLGIGGKVKIEVVIGTDGKVKNSRAVGGHPVLVQAATDCLREWRFEPGPEETTQIIEFEFKQQQQ